MTFSALKLVKNHRVRKILSYSAPTYLSAGIALFIFPFIADRLGALLFGQLDLFLLLGAFLSYSFHFGWSSAHNRYYLEPDVDRSNLITTLLVFRISVWSAVFCLFWFGHGAFLEWAEGREDDKYAVIVVLLAFYVSDLAQFFEHRYRMLGHSRSYLVFALTRVVAYPIILVPGLLYFSASPLMVLLASLIASLFPLVVALVGSSRWMFRGSCDWSLLKRCLRFGIPLVPAGIAVLSLQYLDRAMLKTLISDPEWSLVVLGYYAFAARLVAAINLARSGFGIVWSPYVLKTYREKSASQQYRDIFSSYSFLLLVFCLLVLLAGRVLTDFVMPEYSASMNVLPILLASALAYSVGDYFCIGIDIREKTWIRTIAGIVTLVTNLLLNWILIPSYGAVGAALATLISMVVFTSILLFSSEKLYRVGFPMWQFAGAVLSVLMLAIIVRFELMILVMVIAVVSAVAYIVVRQQLARLYLLVMHSG